MRFWFAVVSVIWGLAIAGCGTTKWTDTKRTATEQLLISDAMDRAVSKLDFRAVAGKTVFLDSTPLAGVTDAAYLTSAMRQQMLAAGCILKEQREDADYVVEVRAGAVGTDRREVMFGVPATELNGLVPLPGVPAAVPEMNLANKTEQRAVAKIAVFAYNRHTGRPVWQSGSVPVESTSKHVWVFGAGPFERGTIVDGTQFAGDRISIPLISHSGRDTGHHSSVSVADPAFFAEPREEATPEQQIAKEDSKQKADAAGTGQPPAVANQDKPASSAAEVVPAAHTAPAEDPAANLETSPDAQAAPKALQPAPEPKLLEPPPNSPGPTIVRPMPDVQAPLPLPPMPMAPSAPRPPG